MSTTSGEYVLGKTLQDCFRDKDSGEPLQFGQVRFFQDANRIIPKEVFKYSGSPGNPTYTSLGSVVDLNLSGTFDDAIYYFPFDAEGNIQLYFVEVYSSPPYVLQFTREAWPDANLSPASGGTEIEINYIPNGQFLISTTIRDYKQDPIAQLNKAGITPISYGGWYIALPTGSTTTVATSFPRQTLNPPPEKDPRYVLRASVVNSGPGDTFRDIECRLQQENIFASTSKQFTFSFQGISNGVSDATVQVYLKRYYGAGGTQQTETLLGTFDAVGSYEKFTKSFIFGTDVGSNLGQSDDDYFALAIRLPLGGATDTSYTNFLLTENLVANPIIPAQTTRDTSSRTLTLPAPAKDGSDLFLGIKLGREGLEYDTSEIGKVIAMLTDAPPGFILCDGRKQITSQYSDIGIPYKRLFDKIGYSFGTGVDFVSAAYGTTSNSFLLANNFSGGSITLPSNGPIPTGFTFQAATSTGFDKGYLCGVNAGGTGFEIVGTKFGRMENQYAGPGTAPMLIARIGGDYLTGGPASGIFDENDNSRAHFRLFGINSSPAAFQGKYFKLDNTTGSAVWAMYIWFTYNGAGEDPAPSQPYPGPTPGIKIDLYTDDNALSIGTKIVTALNNHSSYNITVTSGATIPVSSSFLFSAFSENYYAWYTVNGSGVDPLIAAKTGIKIDILSTDTVLEVNEKTRHAINSFSFQVPDMRGFFLRGALGSADPVIDPDNWFRFRPKSSPVFDDSNNRIGGIEPPMIQSHGHQLINRDNVTYFRTPTSLVGRAGGDSGIAVIATNLNLVNNFTGLRDTRPWNMSVNWVIKY